MALNLSEQEELELLKLQEEETLAVEKESLSDDILKPTPTMVNLESLSSAPINPGIERNPEYKNDPVPEALKPTDDKYSPLETAVAKLAEGGAIGFDDELGGSMSAAGRVLGINNLGGKIGEQSLTSPTLDKEALLQAYRQTRDGIRSKQSEISQESPVMSTTYNVLGGLATGKVVPGMLNPAPAGVSLLGKIGTNTLNALPVSAAVASGMSNADLTKGEVLPFLGDVATGTAIGAGIGAGVPLATGLVSEVSEGVGNSRMMQDILTSYREGKLGTNMRTPEFLKNSRNKLKNIFGQADDEIRAEDQRILGERKTLLTNLNNDPSKFADVGDTINKLSDEINNSPFVPTEQKAQFESWVKKELEKGNFRTPEELDALIKMVRGDLTKTMTSPSSYNAVNNAKTALMSAQDDLDPALRGLNKTAGQITDVGEVLTKRNPLDYNAAKAENQMKESGANMLEGLSENYKIQNFIDEILNGGLDTSKAALPALDQIVPKAAATLRTAAPVANNLRIAKDMQTSALEGGNFLQIGRNAINNLATKAANKSGNFVVNNKKSINNGINNLSKMTGTDLNLVADKLSATGMKTAQNFANLIKETATKEGQAKDAILFGLMQQPTFRKLYNKVIEEDNGITPQE